MRIIPALILVSTSLSLIADTTGRLNGKVTNKAGKPVPSAKVVLKRVDITWNKELKIGADGSFLQVGLLPKGYEITATAEGYAPYAGNLTIGLDQLVSHPIVLLTPQEAQGSAVAAGTVVDDPGVSLENTGADAYNGAVELYNAKKYTEALPLIELAYQTLKESAEKTTDEAAKVKVIEKVATVERTYAITLFEVGIASESKQDLLGKAKPMLDKALTTNPKDTRSLDALLKIAKAQKDKPEEKKYQGMVDAILGPRPEIAYNEAVNAFNGGHLKDAKESVLKAIQIDPKYADSYWLLGVVEFSLNNVGAAKSNFHKYLEIAPSGAKAAEVKLMLKELK